MGEIEHWEHVCDFEIYGERRCYSCTDRMPVDGGWLYRDVVTDRKDEYDDVYTVVAHSLAFVPLIERCEEEIGELARVRCTFPAEHGGPCSFER